MRGMRAAGFRGAGNRQSNRDERISRSWGFRVQTGNPSTQHDGSSLGQRHATSSMVSSQLDDIYAAMREFDGMADEPAFKAAIAGFGVKLKRQSGGADG